MYFIRQIRKMVDAVSSCRQFRTQTGLLAAQRQLHTYYSVHTGLVVRVSFRALTRIHNNTFTAVRY